MIDRLGKVGFVVFAVFAGLAVLSFVLPSMNKMYEPSWGTDPDIIGHSSPSSQHILGTDFLGRDIFSQLCKGAYYSLLHGLEWSLLGVPLLVAAAMAMAQVREDSSERKDTLSRRYIRFGIFPLLLTALYFGISFVQKSSFSFLAWLLLLPFALIFALLGWLALGRDLEIMFRKKEKISWRLVVSGAALIFSYVTLLDTMVGAAGAGSPIDTTWGMMINLWATSLRAPFWQVIPPIVCMYIFSRGMLAISYSLYNTDLRKKYFFKEGWF